MVDENYLNFKNKFVALTIEWGKHISDGNSLKANKTHKSITKLFSSINKADKKTILPMLCEHTSESVRIWAATYLLDTNEELAITVLKNAIAQNTILGLTAEVTLDMWNNKTLEL